MLRLGLTLFSVAVSHFTAPVVGPPTGDGTMDFSIATGDDTGLLALLEDI